MVKVCPARLAAQSEQFANELSLHVGVCAPACRILRKQAHRISVTDLVPCLQEQAWQYKQTQPLETFACGACSCSLP